MSLVAVPISLPRIRRVPWVFTLLIAIGVVALAWGVIALSGGSSDSATAGQFYTVVPMDMDIVINKDGELQAVNNVEVTSPVEGQNVIVEIAKEGDFVHKGDVLCKLDSSDIDRKVETSTLDLQKAQSDLTA